MFLEIRTLLAIFSLVFVVACGEETSILVEDVSNTTPLDEYSNNQNSSDVNANGQRQGSEGWGQGKRNSGETQKVASYGNQKVAPESRSTIVERMKERERKMAENKNNPELMDGLKGANEEDAKKLDIVYEASTTTTTMPTSTTMMAEVTSTTMAAPPSTIVSENSTTTSTMPATTTTTMVAEVGDKEEDETPVTLPKPSPSVAFTSDPNSYAESSKAWEYAMQAEANYTDLPVVYEVLTAPQGFTLNGNKLSGTFVNAAGVESGTADIKVKAYLLGKPEVSATQSFKVLVRSSCTETIASNIYRVDVDEFGAEKLVLLGAFDAFVGAISAVANYNYYSWSAHPINGPKPEGFAETVFAYSTGGQLYFNFIWGVDEGGSEENSVYVEVVTSGNNGREGIVNADEAEEASEAAANPGQKKFVGNFTYWKNTDGFQIGPFSGTSFVIRVSMKNRGDTSKAVWYSLDGNNIELTNFNDYVIKHGKSIECKS